MSDDMMEEWKQLEGYSLYLVSNTGKVKEVSTGRLMPQTVNGGFWCSNLYRDDGVKELAKIHRLVARVYIPNPTNPKRVAHKGNRLDNSVENIYWLPLQVKPEKVQRKPVAIQFRGSDYSIKEFSEVCGVDRSVIKSRLKAGWTELECYLGFKSFKGNGFCTDTHWYPYKGDYDKAISELNTIKREAEWKKIRQEKKQRNENWKKSKEDYLKFGVGNFVNYPIPGIVNRTQTKAYRVWSSMLSRCYSKNNPSYPSYGGRGVYVCKEWYEYQVFAEWYNEQYSEDDWHLDKDILIKGNLEYGPNTCVLVPPVLNTLMATMQDQQRDLPTGVIRTKTEGVYSCQYIENGKRRAKQFTDVYEAALHYKIHKELEIKRITEKFKDVLPDKVYQTFINHTIEIRSEFLPTC